MPAGDAIVLTTPFPGNLKRALLLVVNVKCK